MTLFAPDAEGWRGLLRRVAKATRSRDPEDLLQSAFVRLEEYRSRAEVADPRAFLVRVAVNLAHDERRTPAARLPREPLDAGGLGLADDKPLQDEVLEVRNRLRKVQQALGELSPRTRQVFLMHRIEHLKYREIAAELGITVSAVEKHVAKAAYFLSERMQDEE
jgi:RNA polymerase sigma-70 factor (ECF subfamily)